MTGSIEIVKSIRTINLITSIEKINPNKTNYYQQKYRCLLKSKCLLFLVKEGKEKDPAPHLTTIDAIRTITMVNFGIPFLGYRG